MIAANHRSPHQQASLCLEHLVTLAQQCQPKCQQLGQLLQQQLEASHQSKTELESLFEASFELVPLPISLTCLETGQIFTSNQAFKHLFWGEPTQWIEKPLHCYFAEPRRYCKMVRHLHQHQSQDQAYETVLSLKTLDGKQFDALALAKPVRYEEHWVGLWVFVPVTETHLGTSTEQLQHLNSLLSMALHYAGDAVEITDAQARLKYVNPAYESLTGYTRREVLGKTPAEFLRSGEYDESFYQNIWQTISRGKVWHGAFSGKRKDGALFHQQVTVSPICDATGNVTNFVAVRRNLDQEKQLEQEWHKFVTLVERCNDFVAMFSWGGEVLYVNEAGRQLVGLTELNEGSGRSIVDYLPEADRLQFEQIILPTLASGGCHTSEGQLRHFQSGQLLEVHRNWFVVKHPETDAVIGLATIQRDITAQKKSEAALQESHEQFGAIAEAMPLPMVISRVADGTVLYANSRVERMFGISRDTISSTKIADFYANPRDSQRLQQQLVQRGSVQGYEVKARGANGVMLWVSVSLQSLTFKGEAAILSIFTDITAQKQTELRLKSSVQQQAAIAKLGQRALAGIDLDTLMDEAVTLVAQALRVQYCGVLELLPDGNHLLLQAGAGWPTASPEAALIHLDEGCQLRYTLQTQEPTIVQDFRFDDRFNGSPLHHRRITSGLSVVISARPQPFGVLSAYTEQPHSFNQDDVYFLQAIANVLATAIERKQSESRLRLMERAIESSNNGIVLTDANQPDNPIIYVNPAFEAMTGYSASDVIGRNCRFLQGHDADQAALNNLRAALKEQRECHVTLRNYRKDGTLFWNELYIAPVFDTYGCLTHFVGIQNDITERIHTEITLRDQKEQYRRIVETATEGIWILDRHNNTIFVNQQMAEMLGYSAQDMLGEPLFAFMDEASKEIAYECIGRRQQGLQETHDFKFRRKDGSDLWTIVSTSPLFDQNGGYAGALGMLTDITDRKQAEEALRKSEEQFRLIFELAPIGMMLTQLDGQFVKVNQALCHLLGYSLDDLTDKGLAEVTHPDDLIAEQQMTERLFQGEISHFQIEKRYFTRAGKVVNAISRTALIRDAASHASYCISQVVDITDRKHMEEKLIHDAFYDSLTRLPNRAFFMNQLKQVIARKKRRPEDLFAVLFLDLDRFKVVNDSLGHMVGDRLLVEISQRLQACVRPGDTIARLGGDEFTILLDPIHQVSDATAVAERIQRVLKSPFNLDGYEVFTTASIGIALGATSYTQPEDLLRDADTALYRAKEKGKARHAVFDQAMYDRAVALLQLETDLRRAIERQEFQVFYQPIVSFETECLKGFEALVRWQHPTRGLVSPTEFIPVAEETGLIIPIGNWVLYEACRQMRQWQLQYPKYAGLTISVNLSSHQLSQPKLIQHIDQVLKATNLTPQSLKLELTESAIIDHPDLANTTLQALKQRGIEICVDDFGTGYSSLAYLHRLPIDVLKIDRSFISRMEQDKDQIAIIQAIMTLATHLNLEVIAEGIETVDQLSQLKQIKCHSGQGYLFSKPLNQQATAELLRDNLRW